MSSLPDMGGSRIAGRGAELAETLNPAKFISGAVDSIKGSISQELPELLTIFQSTSNAIGDIANDVKDAFTPKFDKIEDTQEDTKEKIEKVEGVADENLELFHALATWFDGTLDGITDSAASLRSIDANIDLLNEMTKNVWGVSDAMYAAMQGVLEVEERREKFEKFEQQKNEAESDTDLTDDILPKEEKQKKSILDRLLEPLLMFKELLLFKLPFFLGTLGKLLIGLAPAVAGMILVTDVVFGSIKGAISAFKDGEGLGTILYEGLKGGIVQLTSTMSTVVSWVGDLFGFEIDKLSTEDIANAFDDLFDPEKSIFVQGPKMLGKSIAEGFANISKNISNWVYDTFVLGTERWMDKSLIMMKSSFESFINMLVNIPKNIMEWVVDKLPSPVKKLFNITEGTTLETSETDIDNRPSPPIGDAFDIIPEQKTLERASNLSEIENRIEEKKIEKETMFQSAIMEVAQSSQSKVGTYAPVTSVNNTNVIQGNMKTRNPESPLFITNKVMQ